LIITLSVDSIYILKRNFTIYKYSYHSFMFGYDVTFLNYF